MWELSNSINFVIADVLHRNQMYGAPVMGLNSMPLGTVSVWEAPAIYYTNNQGVKTTTAASSLIQSKKINLNDSISDIGNPSNAVTYQMWYDEYRRVRKGYLVALKQVIQEYETTLKDELGGNSTGRCLIFMFTAPDAAQTLNYTMILLKSLIDGIQNGHVDLTAGGAGKALVALNDSDTKRFMAHGSRGSHSGFESGYSQSSIVPRNPRKNSKHSGCLPKRG
jgi:hypothetical protein